MFDEFNKVPKKFNIKPPVGEWQYIYSSKKGKISLIELPDYFRDGQTLWEIYSLEGDLFDDIERFDSKEKAEKRIFDFMG